MPIGRRCESINRDRLAFRRAEAAGELRIGKRIAGNRRVGLQCQFQEIVALNVRCRLCQLIISTCSSVHSSTAGYDAPTDSVHRPVARSAVVEMDVRFMCISQWRAARFAASFQTLTTC